MYLEGIAVGFECINYWLWEKEESRTTPMLLAQATRKRSCLLLRGVTKRSRFGEGAYESLLLPIGAVGKGSNSRFKIFRGIWLLHEEFQLYLKPCFLHLMITMFWFTDSFIHSFTSSLNQCLLRVLCVPNSVLGLRTCNEQEILNSFPYKTYHLEGEQ